MQPFFSCILKLGGHRIENTVVNIAQAKTQKTGPKAKLQFDLKMSPKSGFFLLFWLQSNYAQNSSFGQDVDFPFSSKPKSSPLVHFSQHSGKQGQRIDIVRILYTQFHPQPKSPISNHNEGLGELVCGLYNPQRAWRQPNLYRRWQTLH